MKSKLITTAITLLLALALAIPIMAIPATSGQSTWATYPYIGATPNPVGVGQEVLLHVGITQELQLHRDSWTGLTVKVVKPDGTTETLGPFKTDSTGGTGTVYVPAMIGNYTLQTFFPEQLAPSNIGGGQFSTASIPAGTVMKASSSRILTLNVQEHAIPIWPGLPLPTEYWTRPIDGQLHEWYSISGNWLAAPENFFVEFNADAPETAHILWTKVLAMGGLSGGLTGRDQLPHAFEDGDAYEGKFGQQAVATEVPVIIGGILYYNRFEARGEPYAKQEVVAVNLHTGEEVWCQQLIGLTGNTATHTVTAANRVIDGKSDTFPNGIGRRLSFGQALYWDSFNYHGVFGYLWTVSGSTWMAFDAHSGRWIYTITDVPTGTTLYGPSGELLRIQVNSAQGWMGLWNSTKIVNAQNSGASGDGSWRPHGNVYNASGNHANVRAAWEWNVTIPQNLPGSAYRYKLDDRVVGSSFNRTHVVSWALSLKQGQIGQLLFNKNWNAPAVWNQGNQTISRSAGSIIDGVITYWSKETNQHWGFSTQTGDLMWGPTQPQDYLDLFGHRAAIAYGKLYSQGMSGILHAYDAKTGNLLWTYSADDPFNQVLWANQWHIRPLIITDGKIYMGTSEHSPVDPKPKGGPFVCVDAETGKEIWRADGLFRQTDWGARAIMGDSIVATMDTYDQRIYAIGRGPSAMTVTAPNVRTQLGASILIQGTVNDVSPGTKGADLSMRFPQGVPVVADQHMSDWMLYVYKQFPRPMDAVGVEISIDVFDSNGNYRNIGTTTSDASGYFNFEWQPDIPGKFTIIATFAGTNAYWPSFAQTAFAVDEVPPQPTEQPEQVLPPTELYIAATGIAIILAIAIATLIILKKRP